ncbi:hypothetical protein GW17_00021793, partial [Ensete ventricosum]
MRQGPLQRGSRLWLGPARSHAAGAAANGLQTIARSQLGRGDRLWVRRPQEGSLRAKAPPTRAAAYKGDHQQRHCPWRCQRRGGRPLVEH